MRNAKERCFLLLIFAMLDRNSNSFFHQLLFDFYLEWSDNVDGHRACSRDTEAAKPLLGTETANSSVWSDRFGNNL